MTEPEEVTIFRDFTLRFPNSDDSAMRQAVLAHIDALTAERDALATKLARLATLAAEVANDLEIELNARYHAPNVHPALQGRYNRDMQPVRKLRAVLESLVPKRTDS
jgi:hypothetical protein